MSGPNPDAVVLCCDCRHYRRAFFCGLGGMPAECARPLSETISVVTGLLTRRLNSPCYKERRDGRTWLGRQRCGRAGLFFEEKSPLAQGGEARQGGNRVAGSVHEHPVGEADAPETPSETPVP